MGRRHGGDNYNVCSMVHGEWANISGSAPTVFGLVMLNFGEWIHTTWDVGENEGPDGAFTRPTLLQISITYVLKYLKSIDDQQPHALHTRSTEFEKLFRKAGEQEPGLALSAMACPPSLT